MQRVLDERRQRLVNRHIPDSPYLLSGICRCSACDGAMIVHHNEHRKQPYKYIVCRHCKPTYAIRETFVMAELAGYISLLSKQPLPPSIDKRRDRHHKTQLKRIGPTPAPAGKRHPPRRRLRRRHTDLRPLQDATRTHPPGNPGHRSRPRPRHPVNHKQRRMRTTGASALKNCVTTDLQCSLRATVPKPTPGFAATFASSALQTNPSTSKPSDHFRAARLDSRL